MPKSRFLKPIIASGIVAAAIAGSVLTNFGSADTANVPVATPVVVQQAQPADTIAPTATPEPSVSPVVAPNMTAVQSELNNHETRITALEQPTATPQPPVATVAPLATPVPVTSYPCTASNKQITSICVSN